MSENEKQENEKQANREFYEKKIKESKGQWQAIVDDLTSRLRDDIKGVIDVQAEAISHRQSVVDEINIYSVKVWKLVQKIKVLSKGRFEFYATSYQVKTSGTEKLRLIEADLSEYQLFINIIDEYVSFLRDTSKNLDAINYSVKSKIELTNILGGYK